MSPQLIESEPTQENAIASQSIDTPWYSVCHINYKRDEWVKLLEQPSDFSFDEALLLCQESPESWVAWIPSYGEIVLHRNSFYC